MYRELARAREISEVTKNGSLTLCETGKNIKEAFEHHNIEPDSWYDTKINHLEVFLKQYFDIIPLSSNYQLAWNLLVISTIYYSFLSNLFTILITSNIPTDRGYNDNYHQVNNYLMLVVMLIDLIFVRWRVEEVEQLQQRRNHNVVSRTYFNNYFIIDLVVIIVVIMNIAHVPYAYWKILVFLKIFIFNDIKQQIEVATSGYTGYQLVYTAARLLAFITFWTFFFSAVFVLIELYFVNQRGYFYDYGFLWITSPPTVGYVNLYVHFQWYVWFQYALFFVMQMVRGAGMGVPSPRNPLSMLWYCISNVTMTVMFWYFTDKVMQFINEHVNEDKLLQKIAHLKEVQKVKFFEEGYYQKYQIYLRIDASTEIQATRLEDKLKEMFPVTLHREFNFSMKQHFLLRFQLFKTIVSHSFTEELFKRELAQIIVQKVVYQGEDLYVRNNLQPERLYLSQKSVFIESEDNLEYVEQLPEWSFVGIREFFIEKRPLFNVFASIIAQVEYIEKEKFISVVKLFPTMYEGFCQKMDSMKIEREGTESIGLKCWHCKEDHLTEDCHLIASDKKVLLGILKLRKFDMHLDRKMGSAALLQSMPFFRGMAVGKKVRSDKFLRSTVNIDKYKRRGFSYLQYNVEGLQYFSNFLSEKNYESQIFKSKKNNTNINELYENQIKDSSKLQINKKDLSSKRILNFGEQSKKQIKKRKVMQSEMFKMRKGSYSQQSQSFSFLDK